jgi:hypothetical protein
MNFDDCIEQLTANAAALKALTAGISPDQARWKPSPETWSVLEVVNHLADEEREDFRPFVEWALGGPPKQPHDSDEWIATRGYNERDLAASVADFLQEREKSLAWLRGLSSTDWQTPVAYTYRPGFRAGDVLASWVAHDILHQRQLVELRYALAKVALSPFNVEYAGDW